MNTATADFQILDSGSMSAVSSQFRQELLAALAEPDSAVNLARRFDMSRQRIGYHMRELERAGCIELVDERQQRGLKERLYQVKPIAYVFGPESSTNRRAVQDRYSWASLLNMIAGALWDLVSLRRRADAEDKRLATLAIEANLRFASPQARKDFSEDLVNAIEDVVARHHDPGADSGRNFRLVMGAYPAPATETSKTEH